MASEENRRELEEKVEALVKSLFGGDYRTAFGHYDADSKDEMKALLSDAGIGRGLTRWAWAKGVIGEVDTSGDGNISWDEFAAVFEGRKS